MRHYLALEIKKKERKASPTQLEISSYALTEHYEFLTWQTKSLANANGGHQMCGVQVQAVLLELLKISSAALTKKNQEKRRDIDIYQKMCNILKPLSL